jgi:hypothetical protein
LPWPNGAADCTLVSIKPLESERYLLVDPLDRGPEKLEVERIYAKSIGAAYFVADRSLYPGPLLGQLEWLRTTALLPPSDAKYSLLQAFLDKYSDELQLLPPVELINRLQADFSASKYTADYLIHHCIWTQIIDCDLSEPLDLDRIPRIGGRALRAAILASLRARAVC